MKKIVMAVTILTVLLIAFAGCNTEDTTVSVVSANELPQALHLESVNDSVETFYAPNGESTSRLVLYENGHFALIADEYVSFALSGSYLAENDKLILGTENEHIFTIANDRLIFESGEWLESRVEQGTEFYPSNN
jgi:hypothetical protein